MVNKTTLACVALLYTMHMEYCIVAKLYYTLLLLYSRCRVYIDDYSQAKNNYQFGLERPIALNFFLLRMWLVCLLHPK